MRQGELDSWGVHDPCTVSTAGQYARSPGGPLRSSTRRRECQMAWGKSVPFGVAEQHVGLLDSGGDHRHGFLRGISSPASMYSLASTPAQCQPARWRGRCRPSRCAGCPGCWRAGSPGCPCRRTAGQLRRRVCSMLVIRLLSPATAERVLAATSSFFDLAISAERYTVGQNPMQRRVDHVPGRVPERHQPLVGAASRQQPIRRTVRVRLPLQLPRPMSGNDIDAVVAGLTTMRDRRSSC